MKNKFPLLIFSLALLFLLGSFSQVSACQNFDDSELCGKIGLADAIFVGEVKSPKFINRNYYDEVVFEVKENIFGADEETFSIQWGISNDKCGYLESGKNYLIFARGDVAIYRNNVKIPVKECIQIEVIEESQANLEFLRNFVKNSTGASVSGNVHRQKDFGNINNIFDNQSMPGIKVKISSTNGENFNSETVTDSNGEYEFKNVPIGNYKISPLLPDFWELRPFMTDKVSVKKNFGCLFKNFVAENASEISGKILDADGNPLDDLTVEIIPLDKELKPQVWEKSGSGIALKKSKQAKMLEKIVTQNSLTNEKGEFSFYNLPVGKYVLAVNFKYAPNLDSPYPTLFYPDSKTFSGAQIFDIELGKKVDNFVFRLSQRLEPVEIMGKVILKNNKIPENTQISLKDLTTNQHFEGELSADGNFTLKGFEGRKYQIIAQSYWTSDTLNSERINDFYADSSIFVLKRKPSFYTLNLKERQLKTEKIEALDE